MYSKILTVRKPIAFMLVLAVCFSLYCPMTAKASDVAVLIPESDWLANSAQYISEALETYYEMGASVASEVAVVCGSAVFAYAAYKGIPYVVDTATDTALYMGRYMIDNLDTYDDEIQRYVCSTILNVSDYGTEYYVNTSNMYSSRLLTSIDHFLGNTITTDIAINAGLVSPALSDYEAAAYNHMTQAQLDYITKTNTTSHQITAYNQSSVLTGCIITQYFLPASVVYVLVKPNGIVELLDKYGKIVTISSAPNAYLMTYLGSTKQWTGATKMTSFALNAHNFDVDYGGLKVLTGSTYADAIGLTTTIPAPWAIPDEDTALPYVPSLTIPWQTAIDIGVGEKDIADYVDAVPDAKPDTGTDTATGWASLWSWLSNILDAIKAIPLTIVSAIVNGVTDIVDGVTDVVDGIKSIPDKILDVLSRVFIPSDTALESVQTLLNQKLPIIDQLSSWIDDLMKIMQNPNSFASNLTFEVDMSKAENTYWNWGNSKSNALSVTWYTSKYKSTVDDIIVGIAWLIFLWNLHAMLPSIISCVSTVTFASANASYQKTSGELRRSEMDFRAEKLEYQKDKLAHDKEQLEKKKGVSHDS